MYASNIVLCQVPTEDASSVGTIEKMINLNPRQPSAETVTAFRTVVGPRGFTVLAKADDEAAGSGLLAELRSRFLGPTDSQVEHPPGDGFYRFAAAFAGASVGAEVKLVLVIGRGAGSIPLDEFRQWYDTDHMLGLAALPGVVGAARYESADAPEQFLALYELADPDIQLGPLWPTVGKTAWTARVRSRYRKWLDLKLEPIL